MRTKNKKLRYKNKLILGVLIVAALGIGALVYTKFISNHSPRATKIAANGVNYGPPTDEERKAGDNQKDTIGQQQEQPEPSTPAGTAQVSLTYGDVYGDGVEVGAKVTNLLEEGGTCTLKLSKAGKEVTTSVQAIKNVSGTDCPAMIIATNKLSSGVWGATVAYTSAAASGTSKAKDINVP